MGLDAGTVLKRSVLCAHCNADYYFTLRAIANNPESKCLGCGGRISLTAPMNRYLVMWEIYSRQLIQPRRLLYLRD